MSLSILGKVLDSNIRESEFELDSRYKVYFRTNTLGKKYKPSYSSSYGLNSTTSGFFFVCFFYKDEG